VIGVAYGYLFSRLALVAQDLFTIRLLKAGGWLDVRNWKHAVAQCCAGAVFALGYLFIPRDSLWLLVPALLHGGLVAAWILRRPLYKFFAGRPGSP
jgi:hypothetical protein